MPTAETLQHLEKLLEEIAEVGRRLHRAQAALNALPVNPRRIYLTEHDERMGAAWTAQEKANHQLYAMGAAHRHLMNRLEDIHAAFRAYEGSR